jgi:hypothetical protein
LSLKLGINVVNSDALRRRTLAPFLDGFLDTVREGHPDTPLLVVTPILCPMHEDAGGPTIALDRAGRLSLVAGGTAASGVQGSLSLRDVREIVEAVVRRRQRDDARLHLLDGLSLLGAREAGALTDGLHPSPAGYRLIGHRFAAALVRMAGGAPLSTRIDRRRLSSATRWTSGGALLRLVDDRVLCRVLGAAGACARR